MTKKKKAITPPPAKQQPVSQADEQKTIVAHSVTQSWSGPLPPPSILESFDDVVPGSAKTIFEMAQGQQDHRMHMESMVAHDRRLGLIAGTVTAIIALGGAIYLANTAPWVAVSLISLPVLGIIKVLTGRSEKSNAQRKK